jgi:hypothetical protein
LTLKVNARGRPDFSGLVSFFADLVLLMVRFPVCYRSELSRVDGFGVVFPK